MNQNRAYACFINNYQYHPCYMFSFGNARAIRYYELVQNNLLELE
jgi:hypothetical protein